MTSSQLLARFALAFTIALSSSAALDATGGLTGDEPKERRPALSLTVTPTVAFAPVRVLMVASVRGGADDDQQFYCPSVEWDWGDGTVSEASSDCPPFEAGSTKIQRRYTKEHIYREGGQYDVRITLKHKDKAFSTASNTVAVRPGLGDRAWQ